jgi:hypothetical protein
MKYEQHILQQWNTNAALLREAAIKTICIVNIIQEVIKIKQNFVQFTIMKCGATTHSYSQKHEIVFLEAATWKPKTNFTIFPRAIQKF